jgi:hypothetical protein
MKKCLKTETAAMGSNSAQWPGLRDEVACPEPRASTTLGMTARQHGIASSAPNSDGNDEGGGKMTAADGEVGRCSGWAYMTSESFGVRHNIERRTEVTRHVSSLTGGLAVVHRQRPSLGPVHSEKWAMRGAVVAELRWG